MDYVVCSGCKRRWKDSYRNSPFTEKKHCPMCKPDRWGFAIMCDWIERFLIG